MLKPKPDASKRWLAPQPGYSKINVDGAFSRGGETAAAMAFCRDASGIYVGASALVLGNINDSTVIEALACREGLALAADLNLASITIASDCQTLVTDIDQGSSAANGAIVREIQGRMGQFISCLIIHERRNFNFEAHNLAKHATSLGFGRYVWLDLPYDPLNVPVNIAFTV